MDVLLIGFGPFHVEAYGTLAIVVESRLSLWSRRSPAMKRLLKTLNELSKNAALDPSDRVLDAERAISNYLVQYRGKLRKQRRKLEKLDNEIVSFTGDFWSDVRMFIALRLKQLDGDRELSPRLLLKPKKRGTRGGGP